MRVLFALPGLHRIDRGAEIALLSVAKELASSGTEVTVFGSGGQRSHAPYRFRHVGSISRQSFESWPSLPALRNETAYEEVSFVPGLLWNYRAAEYDVTVTCSYPFTNWVLRRPVFKGKRPSHVFVTQNGDWPAYARNSEYRFFGCEGLVCTNPDYYERNRDRWRCKLIPNGVNCEHFHPGPPDRDSFGLPRDRFIVLMVSALVPSKRVDVGVDAVSKIPDAHLVVAGDGPLRQAIDTAAAELLPERFTRLSVPASEMPSLYRSADLFLHLSKEESFGNVFLEALACGLPVVGHDSARLRWIVGDHEFLIDTSDPTAVADEIRRARDGGAARVSERTARAAPFAWSEIAKSYRAFFDEVVGTGRSAP
jgi:glycosyltransferase involved in cell wall biosynthesis